MAKKNKDPKYYAYYDKKTRKICSITNEKSTVYKQYIEITFDEFKNFCDGEWHIDNYTVVDTLGLVAIDSPYNFKNSMFEWISEQPTDKTHCIVTWNGPKKIWEFKISNETRKLLAETASAKLSFFVTLENDLNFLIRTISFNVEDIVQQDSIKVPFESKLENDVDTISIASVRTFKTYGLEVIHE